MRLKSVIWVKAYLRRCMVEGVPAVVARRGDDTAGDIFIRIHCLDGQVKLYGPAPGGEDAATPGRRWTRRLAGREVSEAEAVDYLARQTSVDPDIWVLDVEDRAGRHFLGDQAIED